MESCGSASVLTVNLMTDWGARESHGKGFLQIEVKQNVLRSDLLPQGELRRLWVPGGPQGAAPASEP